jgi:RNA polymerase sigma-70 factor (ECF subfamily)
LGDHVADARLFPLTADRWLVAFHAGDRGAVEQCYRAHQPTVAAVVGRLLPAVDAETVTHEVFYRLLTDAELRANFRGGNFAGWLTRVATNSAIDYLRRARRERPGLSEEHAAEADTRAEASRVDEELEAKRLVERFRSECLPLEWTGVFEARFLRQISQRKAAQELRMHRTTLAYQEHRIRTLLRKFLIRAEMP